MTVFTMVFATSLVTDSKEWFEDAGLARKSDLASTFKTSQSFGMITCCDTVVTIFSMLVFSLVISSLVNYKQKNILTVLVITSIVLLN